jgi:hypothetical protein
VACGGGSKGVEIEKIEKGRREERERWKLTSGSHCHM